MRPEFDSEIDSVLRGQARRGGAASAAWDAAARPSISDESRSGPHLDADEIAAFGEDALPASARALYSAHLADCDDCRRSVTQVAFAAGVADRINERERADAAAAATGRVAEGERAAAHATPSAAAQSPSAATQQSPSWRERLSSVFAPRAWRYAMPVVALFALGAVVFVAMRGPLREGALDMGSRGGSAEQQRAAAPAAPAAPELHHAGAKQQPAGTTAETQPADAGAAGVAPANEEREGTAAAGEFAKLRAKSADSVDPSAPVSTVGPTVTQREVVQLPSAQPAPPPATANYTTTPQPSPVPSTPAAATAAPRAMISRDGVPLAMPTPSPVEPEMRGRGREEARAVPRDEPPATKRHGPQRSAAGRSAQLGSAADAAKDDRAMSRPARGTQKNEANRDYPDEARAKREEDRAQQSQARQQQAETRSVGGRNFRREGNAWIDTAYRSGQKTVSMRRDSEQYRALVADEPEIGRISRSLGGEAVIVWKGRAYRVKP